MIKTAAPSGGNTLERLDVLESTNSSFYLTRHTEECTVVLRAAVHHCHSSDHQLARVSLGVFNLMNTFTSGTITGTPAEDGGLDDTVSRLRTELEELKRNVSACSAKHDNDLAEILRQLQASLSSSDTIWRYNGASWCVHDTTSCCNHDITSCHDHTPSDFRAYICSNLRKLHHNSNGKLQHQQFGVARELARLCVVFNNTYFIG